MRRFLAVLFLLGSILITKNIFAEESTGWMPKWHIGDWWVVELSYNYSPPNSHKSIKKSTKVKYEITGEEVLDGEKVYHLQITHNEGVPSMAPSWDVYVSENNLNMRKLKTNWSNELIWINVFNKTTPGPYTGGENFSLYTIPIFPLINNPKGKFHKMSIINTFKNRTSEEKRNINQKSLPISYEELDRLGIPGKFFTGRFHRVTINHGNIVQIWSEDINWYVYYEQGFIKGNLKEYHISGKESK